MKYKVGDVVRYDHYGRYFSYDYVFKQETKYFWVIDTKDGIKYDWPHDSEYYTFVTNIFQEQ